MKTKLNIKSLAFGALVGAAIVFSVAAATSPPGRTVWEYKTVERWVEGDDLTGLEPTINSSIAEGWEFVSASSAGPNRGFAVLKRKKNNVQ